MPLINGFMAARFAHVAAELGVADLLASGAQSTDSLASENSYSAASLVACPVDISVSVGHLVGAYRRRIRFPFSGP